MQDFLQDKSEKKVEYLELIYDLIFVYIIGRNNSLLHDMQNGVVHNNTIITYFLYTLAVIQIWNFSTYYINVHGKNSVRNHIFIFINMFFLYFMGSGTKMNWRLYQTRYHVAWACILINLAVQYLLELRNYKEDPFKVSSIRKITVILLVEAGLVLAAAGSGDTWRIYLTTGAIVFGILTCQLIGRGSHLNADFMHLSERAMLFVVFTFGEMIIVIADYFEGPFTLNNLYFSLMGFLIVVGLFLSYGLLYDHIIDREMETNGLVYLFLHVWMIFGLNNLSSALKFMQEEGDMLPKMLYLIASFLIYYGFLFATKGYAKPTCREDKRVWLPLVCIGLSFLALMLVFRNRMQVNIFITVAYVFLIFFLLYRYARWIDSCECDCECNN